MSSVVVQEVGGLGLCCKPRGIRILHSGQSSTVVEEAQGVDISYAHRNWALTISAQLVGFLLYKHMCVMNLEGLPWWLSGKKSACQFRRCEFDPGSERSPGGGNGSPLSYSCPENPMDGGAWPAIVHAVAKEPDTSQ